MSDLFTPEFRAVLGLCAEAEGLIRRVSDLGLVSETKVARLSARCSIERIRRLTLMLESEAIREEVEVLRCAVVGLRSEIRCGPVIKDRIETAGKTVKLSREAFEMADRVCAATQCEKAASPSRGKGADGSEKKLPVIDRELADLEAEREGWSPGTMEVLMQERTADKYVRAEAGAGGVKEDG